MRETYMDKPKLLYCCYLSGTTKLPELFQQRAKVDEERRKNEALEASQSRTQQQKLREEKLKESEKQEDEDWKNSWVKHGLMWLMDVIYI